MELFAEYALFFAKTATVVIAIAIVIGLAAASSKRGRDQERLHVRKLNEKYNNMKQALEQASRGKTSGFKLPFLKKNKQKKTAEKISEDHTKPRLFVLDFHGDLRASSVSSLRHEVTAILSAAREGDAVLVNVENAGGVVHDHGLAASQLARLRQRNIPLTVSVDKVAASGGYLMACVADRIIAAPFAILGSIGVLAQIPNFYQLLNEHGVKVEQLKAGQFKRTVTMFGENTDEDRAKVQAQLEDTHDQFKTFVTRFRPSLNIEEVATGEYWHGERAQALNLVDELQTSDDFLLAAVDTHQVLKLEYKAPKNLMARLLGSVGQAGRAAGFWH